MTKMIGMEYRIRAQRAVDNVSDNRGTCDYEGPNFSDLVLQAERDGYPRIIGGHEREVSPWRPVTGYTFAEATE
jgi:hypothetical protein